MTRVERARTGVDRPRADQVRSGPQRSRTGRNAFRFGVLASVVTVLATLTIGAPAQAAPVPQPATNHRDVAAWNTYANAGGHFTQGDATYTHKLLDGRILWLFADSFLGTTTFHPTPAPGYYSRGASPMLKNQLLVEDPSTNPPTFNQVWLNGSGQTNWSAAGCVAEWPLASIQTTLNTVQTLLRCVDGNMKVLRIDVATTTFTTNASGWTTTVAQLPKAFDAAEPCNATTTANVEFGSSVLQTWGGTTYIYGLQRCAGFTHTMVAKVTGNDLVNGTWSYWNKNAQGTKAWRAYDVGDAAPITDSAGGNVIHAGDEFSVAATGSGLRMITSDVGIGPIVKYTAAPGAYTGPFTQDPSGYYFTPPEIGQVARQTGTPDPNCRLTTYGAKEHPALESGGNLVFSYNVNVPSSCALNALPADLRNYRARFHTVP